MTLQGQSVLRLATDAVLLCHFLRRLPHAFAGGRLGDRRSDGPQISRARPRQRAETCAKRARLPRLDEDLAEAPRVQYGNAGERLHTARDDRIGMAERDLVGGVGNGLAGGGAGAVERVGRDVGGELGEETDFAGHVGREHRGHHLAENHLVDFPAVELAEVEHFPCGVTSKCDRGNVAEHGAAPGERSAQARDDRDPPIRPSVVHVAPR